MVSYKDIKKLKVGDTISIETEDDNYYSDLTIVSFADDDKGYMIYLSKGFIFVPKMKTVFDCGAHYCVDDGPYHITKLKKV